MPERDDKRGAKPGKRKGTPHEGKVGNVPHERNEAAAAIIERLSVYGLPQNCICDFLAWAQDEPLALDLGSQGYSIDTLARHYRDAIDRGRIPGKDMLLGRVYQMAMMENVPEGVSKDRAYAIAADKIMALLNIQHGIMPHQSHRLSGPGGGPIPIALIEATLTAEEIDQLARITAKLEAAARE
jgi:hypothetical protein